MSRANGHFQVPGSWPERIRPCRGPDPRPFDSCGTEPFRYATIGLFLRGLPIRSVLRAGCGGRTAGRIYLVPGVTNMSRPSHYLILVLSLAAMCAFVAGAWAGPGSYVAQDSYHSDYRSTPKLQFSPTWAAPAGLSGETLAQAFLADHAADYRLPSDLSNLRLHRIQESLLGTHYSFQQSLHGFDVEGAEIIVSVSKKSGEVYRIFNNTYPVKNPPAAPGSILGEDTAYDIAWNALRAHGDLLAPATQRTLYAPIGGSFQLQTIVDLELSAPYGGWRTRIDAASGAILSIEDARIYRVKNTEAGTVEERIGAYSGPVADRRTAFARCASAAAGVSKFDPADRAAGTGKVFDPDPRTTLQNATIQDGSPAQTFTAAYVIRDLQDITYDGSLYTLTGPWCAITDWDPPSTPPSTTTDGNWTALRGNNAFNDALVYFHIDQTQRYIQSLGFTHATGIVERPIVTDSDGVNGQDNSYFSGGRLAFGHGCVDDSEDADVVLHEYGHAIHYSINPSWGGGDCGAIGEGFGDYWAGSYSYSTPNGATFHPEWIFSWDGHGSPALCWAGRILNAFGAQYNPNTTYDAHVTIPGGYQSDELWSTPIFQTLITVMGLGYTRESVDQIILESHFGLGSGVRMRELANVTIATAQELQPGNPHADVFVQKFLVHNIILQPFVGLEVHGVTVSDAGANGAADPGETVHLHVVLKNAGTLGAVGVSGLLTSSTPGVTISVDTSAYGDIAPGASATNATDFVVSFPATIPCGDPVQFSLAADYEPEAVPPAVLGFELRMGKLRGVSQSTEPALAIPDNNPAGVSSYMRVSGTGATVSAGFNVDVNITHTYIGDLIVRIVSPNGTTVTLHNMTGDATQNLIGNYPGTLTPYQSLLSLIGGPLDGNWRLFVSDNGAVDLGTINSWGINDIQGYDCEGAADAPAGTPALRFSLSQNQPNPQAGETSIRYAVSRSDLATRLEIIDVSGRIVRTLVNGMLNAGDHVQVWDGRDEVGNTVGAGVYFYRLHQGGDSATRKLLMVR